jgi:hypothetical protein
MDGRLFKRNQATKCIEKGDSNECYQSFTIKHMATPFKPLSLIRLRVMLKDVTILPQIFGAHNVAWFTIALRHVNTGINMITPQIV